MAPAGHGKVLATGSLAAGFLLLGGAGPLFSAPSTRSPATSGAQAVAGARAFGQTQASASERTGEISFGVLVGALSAAAAAVVSRHRVVARARASDAEEATRRDALLASLGAAAAALAAEEAAEAQVADIQNSSQAFNSRGAAPTPAVELPDRINTDPYELIGMDNPEDAKEDYKVFWMKEKYRNDTYQVMKHMKISASLDKGTPNMEKWNKRVKEEMNDWLALYRRQTVVVGRQSYYSLYSAVNTLASHFTSYGTKFPFPNKRRPRFFELTNQVEKYLEKGK
eukprot:TRINITY_DN1521_c0_g3_i1.p1 TRINITY_DN1521_c0_g3~~TRINITY_DN1521_c0_g3_i1.p1  ORF type:complete len:305 (+),score=68.69 TRINITY_DN1521_c0_g3_i1:67-915(+)